eukprot:3458543-Amphidinium_carterae.1
MALQDRERCVNHHSSKDGQVTQPWTNLQIPYLVDLLVLSDNGNIPHQMSELNPLKSPDRRHGTSSTRDGTCAQDASYFVPSRGHGSVVHSGVETPHCQGGTLHT